MKKHICPWYVGYLLANPLRRLFQNPKNILRPFIKEGMTILEVGPGMGFFSLPLAKFVGETGRVVCVDLQEKMIKSLRRRADKAGLLTRIETRLSTETSLQIDDLREKVDFALAFAVVHEVSDPKKLFTQIFNSLKREGMLLVSEPTGHVTKGEFDTMLSIAQSAGLKILDTLNIACSHSVTLSKISDF